MQTHSHDLSYILKTDGEGHYMGRIRELPAVMPYGISEKEIEHKLPDATLSYFKAFSDVHDIILKEQPKPKITEQEWSKGIVIGTKPIKVNC